ncbi:hypothetical protein [Coleofasciculus sp. G2-EDA-02]|uniref:hypothetical protein n=1 Tax=Coleofasciculus sp. G2-EDA-02 TaxID=3069529 RepID=UPI003301B617
MGIAKYHGRSFAAFNLPIATDTNFVLEFCSILYKSILYKKDAAVIQSIQQRRSN